MKRAAEVVIIGGGCMGASVAYHLARRGVTDVVLVERDALLGTGSTGRNAGGVRHQFSNEANIRLSIESIGVLERFADEVGQPIDFHQDGYLFLLSTPASVATFRQNAALQRSLGVDVQWLDPQDAARLAPGLDVDGALGATFCQRDGIADPNGVTMGFARAAQLAGVSIERDTEVTGIRVASGRVAAVETTRGTIATERLALAVAGHSSHVVAMAGITLPIETHVLQAMVSDPVKPVLDTVVTSGAVHFYISQSDKGELVMGGDLDFMNSYAQRGNLPIVEHVVGACLTLFPTFGRMKLMRTWGGICDMTMDGSPIIAKLPVQGLYMTGGWCYGGFKATPASGFLLAHTIARDAPHELNAAFTLERFAQGRMIDEKGAGPYPWHH